MNTSPRDLYGTGYLLADICKVFPGALISGIEMSISPEADAAPSKAVSFWSSFLVLFVATCVDFLSLLFFFF